MSLSPENGHDRAAGRRALPAATGRPRLETGGPTVRLDAGVGALFGRFGNRSTYRNPDRRTLRRNRTDARFGSASPESSTLARYGTTRRCAHVLRRVDRSAAVSDRRDASRTSWWWHQRRGQA